MTYMRSYRLRRVFVWAAVAFMLMGAISWKAGLIWIGFFTAVAGEIQAAIFYKCPKCKAHWDCRVKPPQYCPECGWKIQWEEE